MPVLLVLLGVYLYFTGGRYMSTDDAYVQSARAQISANIAGRVTQIAVEDNQPVHQGDVLFKLDDRDYLIAVEDAKAKLAAARLQITALKTTFLRQQANVRAAKETLEYQQREWARQKTLAKQGISSKAQLDQATHAVLAAQQAWIAAGEESETVRANLSNNPNIDSDRHPSVMQAKAMLDRALLNLSYTTITAPVDGVVTKVEQLQVGDYINAAVPVFALVSSTDIWVEANYKETEMTHMRPGQPATITLDTYPGRIFHGEVGSVSPGTGSSFSLLPPENASGNWVKIVQRLPVRVRLTDRDEQFPFHAGMSATVRVDTGHTRLENR